MREHYFNDPYQVGSNVVNVNHYNKSYYSPNYPPVSEQGSYWIPFEEKTEPWYPNYGVNHNYNPNTTSHSVLPHYNYPQMAQQTISPEDYYSFK